MPTKTIPNVTCVVLDCIRKATHNVQGWFEDGEWHPIKSKERPRYCVDHARTHANDLTEQAKHLAWHRQGKHKLNGRRW